MNVLNVVKEAPADEIVGWRVKFIVLPHLELSLWYACSRSMYTLIQ